MSKDRKWQLPVLLVASVLAVLMSLSGCSRKDSSESEKPAVSQEDEATQKQNVVIGFSQIGAESAWRWCNTESIQKAAEAAGYQIIYSNAEQKQENQIKAIRSFIVYKVDVIVFIPIVKDGWDNVLKEARDANIPVIIVDRMINTSDDSLYAGYVGTDSYGEGRKAASFLLNRYAGQDGPFNILEIRGTEGSSVADGRYEGFREGLSKTSKFNIVYSESGDFMRSRGKEIAQNLFGKTHKLLVNGQKIDIIFSHNDAMTLGLLETLEEYGIKPGKDVVIISVDAEQAAIDAVKEGKINCVVECNPKQGPTVMEMVNSIMNGWSIPKSTYIPEVVFHEHEDLSQLQPRGY